LLIAHRDDDVADGAGALRASFTSSISDPCVDPATLGIDPGLKYRDGPSPTSVRAVRFSLH
jgi:hypothetical protein